MVSVKYLEIKLRCQIRIIVGKHRIICKVCKDSKERVEAQG
jgi:hypothetical protein